MVHFMVTPLKDGLFARVYLIFPIYRPSIVPLVGATRGLPLPGDCPHTLEIPIPMIGPSHLGVSAITHEIPFIAILSTMPGNRRSIRLAGHDYARPDAYFVTLCVQNRECLFGEVHGSQMRLNDFGRIVHEEWLRTPHIRPGIALDAFVVMPNHLHGILVIEPPLTIDPPTETTPGRGNPRVAPTGDFPMPDANPGPRNGSLGAIIALLKSATGRRINEIRHSPGVRVWQRNYYDHIIRHADALERIRWYIEMNPWKWERDRENSFSLLTRTHRSE